jgi:hypothetical protein
VEGYSAGTDVQQDTKTKLFSGLTKNEDAIAKYLKALPVISAISEEILLMAHMTSNVLSDDCLASKDGETLRKLAVVKDEKVIPFRNQTL